ncbi:MAG: thiamine pyrophosphate-dependent dehydrogenase E1 component subunit alpha [Actinomycetota bacterium]|nr:thiamine pyrophosphate-dependent dehydrogenase E1 component subunit alpha [Actinomycetota bacterium]
MIENFDKEKCLDIYRLLKMSRRFEQKTLELGGQGEILGSLHVGVGQEAVHVGIALALKKGDIAFRTHRDSGQMVAEGIEPKYLFAELMGKINGYCKGLGGSMHLPGISGVLGVNVPMASGAALAFKIRNEKRVAVGQYGDGASNLGPLHEAMNMAAIWKLPAVFICENNGYAVTTSIKYSSLLKNLSDRGKAWGIPGETVDGMDVMAVYKAASRLIERARSGEGPAILECKTYRFEDHSKSTANLVLSYRSKDEIAEWMEKDPISRWSGRLLNEKICTQDEIDKIDETVEKDIEEAVEFAKNSPLPEPEDAFKYMYATKIEGIPQKGW